MMRHGLALAVVAFLPFGKQEPVTPYAEVIDTIVRAEREGKWEEALAGAELLLEDAEALGLSEYQRAELHFASGVVLADRRDVEDPDDLREALPPFGSARALAGPGDLRLDAGYNGGVTEFLRAERYRARISELGGQPARPPADDEEKEEEDPLETAREGYRAAKERLVARLRADWSDEDTRANLELIQRRLHELDEIERQREEQERQQQDENQDQGQDGEPQDDEDESEDQEGDEQEPQDQGEEGDQQNEQEGEQETEAIETEAGEDEAPREPEPAPTMPPQEQNLTKEEEVRLLEVLRALEEQGAELQRMLKQARREPVKRDW